MKTSLSSVHVYESDDAVRLLDVSRSVVIKYFKDDSNDAISVKFWFNTDADKVSSFWNTKKVERSATASEVKLIDDTITKVMSTLKGDTNGTL